MLETTADVFRALRRYQDVFDPKGGSVIMASSRARDQYGEPFRPGFLTLFDERSELVHRMRTRLTVREQVLLMLWFWADLPAGVIARKLSVSRRHCYRLRDKAVRSLSDEPAEENVREDEGERAVGEN